jgi:hypothetical protein
LSWFVNFLFCFVSFWKLFVYRVVKHRNINMQFFSLFYLIFSPFFSSFLCVSSLERMITRYQTIFLSGIGWEVEQRRVSSSGPPRHRFQRRGNGFR